MAAFGAKADAPSAKMVARHAMTIFIFERPVALVMPEQRVSVTQPPKTKHDQKKDG
jgi:hypothetical protein